MKHGEHQVIVVRGGADPVVEMDGSSVYVRFRRGKVARTLPRPARLMHLAVDLDAKGRLLGIEAVGVTEFRLATLLTAAQVSAPDMKPERVRFRATAPVAA